MMHLKNNNDIMLEYAAIKCSLRLVTYELTFFTLQHYAQQA